ncbi:MAG: hypothetical protein PHQ40_03530 [Anaerolineaceae bacterium]|nr:hypothetical protein [Anaerolineaceae bacterium]
MNASVEHYEPLETQRTGRKQSYKPLLLTICLLLIVLVGLTTYQAITNFQQNQIAANRAASYQERVKAAQALADTQQTTILGLMDDYNKAAYKSSSVDRISEQQLIAAEYNLEALQVLAIQNSQVIQLLSNMP